MIPVMPLEPEVLPLVRDDGVTAVASVADELVRRIVGELTPGASLPSEAELAAAYGVSRVTVREAVKMLAGRGLLELSRGRRAVVREPDGAALGEFMGWIVQYDPKGVFDLVEVRLSLEVQAAGLAARRATRPAVAAIEATLRAMREAAGPLDAEGRRRRRRWRFTGRTSGFTRRWRWRVETGSSPVFSRRWRCRCNGRSS